MEENNSQNSEHFSQDSLIEPDESINEQEKIREIQIDSRLASKQIKLNISDIEIYFPYEPYENQILYMKKVIETLKSNGMAGLESPTGTGKTLCLLCASLGYLKFIREQMKIEEEINGSKKKGRKRQPVIFYTSRTHAQIANVIRELKKTVYRPINSVISSREQSCVNDYLSSYSGGFLNLKCKYAVKKGECKYYKSKSLKEKGWSAFDGLTVDELKEKGKKYKFCPYNYEKEKSKYSDMVFLPYNYIFDVKILVTTKLVLNNSILIIDEAHNLQDICCDSSSIDLSTNIIDEVINDLKGLKLFLGDESLSDINPPLSSTNMEKEIKPEYLQNEIFILKIIKERIMNYKLINNKKGKWINPGIKLNTEEFFNLIFKEYKDSQKTIQFFSNKNEREEDNNSFITNNNIILDSIESDNELKPSITYKNISTHIGFLKSVEYYLNNERGKGTLISAYTDFLAILQILSNNYYKKKENDDPLNLFVNSYRFYIEEIKDQEQNTSNKKNKKNNNSNDNKRILHIFCFNPGLGFKLIMDQNLFATIITSGTLSPLDSMESELKYNFNVKLENNHVIFDNQFHFCILTSSIFNNMEFNFNAEKRFNTEMIYQLGLTILEFTKFTPGGILVFFSSYKLMDKYVDEWSEKNIISQISKYKEFYHDTRDPKKNKLILNKYQKANSDREKYKGGILLSVCRGSCSEGMNFKDDMARLVIVIGIPYAMLYDPKIQLKKEFQDEYNKLFFKNSGNSKIKKITGSEWYTQNAIKCVNQSLGRVIRHSNDYGAMVLIDTRYQNLVRYTYISQWMRKKCKIYNNEIINKSFFSDMKNFFLNVENFIKEKKLKNKSSQISTNSIENKYTKTSTKKSSSKNPKIILEKMNETEKLSKSNKITINSKNRIIHEIRIGHDKKEEEEETKNSEKKLENIDFLEELNKIDESYFDNLPEAQNSKDLKNSEETNEISDEELINEIMKKKNNKKFKEALEKEGLEVLNEKENEPVKNSLSCYICYNNTNESDIKLEVGKCGHVCCLSCWSKLENKKGEAQCPVCRKTVKKKERNRIFI